tara:strand:+ start:197 stop:412 length:216 start_codon:yes stop_codon:yes gene_type:complete
MGSSNSKSNSPDPTENVFISYYCDHLVNQKKINISSQSKDIKKETFQNVYDFRKNSLRKKNSETLNSKNKI